MDKLNRAAAGRTAARAVVAGAWAVATCMAAAGAQAQSQLVVYGAVDANVTHLRATGRPSEWQIRDGGLNASRLGFRASENLGGGYRVGMVLESQFNLNNGTATTHNTTNQPSGNVFTGGVGFIRKATLSLHTPAGELRFGRDYTTSFVPTSLFDPFQSAGIGSATNFQAFHTPTLMMPTLVRASNMLAYFSPRTWWHDGYVFAQAAPSEGDGASYAGIGASVLRGSWRVRAGIQQTRNPLGGTRGLSAETVSADNRFDVWSIGTSYDFGPVAFLGFYQSQTLAALGTTPATTERDRRIDDWVIGSIVEQGPHRFKFTYMQRDDRSLSDSDPTQIAVGWLYGLSARTVLYVNVAQIRNSERGTYGFAFVGVSPTAGGSTRGMQIGMDHTF